MHSKGDGGRPEKQRIEILTGDVFWVQSDKAVGRAKEKLQAPFVPDPDEDQRGWLNWLDWLGWAGLG